MVFHENGAWDLQMILNALEFGNLNVIDEFLLFRYPKGTSSKSSILNSLNNKIGVSKILFPYWPVTASCVKKLGIKFFFKKTIGFL